MADMDASLNAFLLYPASLSSEYRTVRSDSDAGGLGIRRQKWQNPRYKFQLEARFPTVATFETFLAFFESKKGAKTSFTWTAPTQIDSAAHVYTCIFPEDSLSIVASSHSDHRVSFALWATR